MLLVLIISLIALIAESHQLELKSGAICAEKLSSCSCRLNDGQIIDLTPLQATPGPAFNFKATDGYTYQYNPCLPFQCGPSQSDAAACQEMLRIITTYTDFGSQSSAQFGSDQSSGKLYLRYLSQDMSRTTTVNLICDPGAESPSITSPGAAGTQLTMDLTSRFACPTAPGQTSGGPSGGDILLIIFFSLIFVYLVAGVLLNRFLRQRSGLQLLPNVDFWMSVPGLAVDGVAFTFGQVKRLVKRDGGSYESVK